jgi:hypothetical protein
MELRIGESTGNERRERERERERGREKEWDTERWRE